MDLAFGVFDHLDRNELPLNEFYETRLKIIEAYDRGGFYGYHIAEHHATPLGMAPSPSVFLSAVAQRTKRLRFGPLVYLLPLYHPLRLIEEVAMLDQMSGGRFLLGVGRGISPIEVNYYGIAPDDRVPMYVEALALLRAGLANKILNFDGKFYRYRDVPMELAPVQKPHPPIWVGLQTADSAARAGQEGFNIVMTASAKEAGPLTAAYRAGQRAAGRNDADGKIGVTRFVILADTDEAALASARRAYPKWQRNFSYLFRMHGRSPVFGDRPEEFDQIKDGGRGIAGSPKTVTDMIRAQMAEAGANYFVGQFAFGDLSLAEVLRTVDLFVGKVMPALTR
jgi:alkanesulfonate monooxygenase SsuD/methylene tetrahydromethanopterin reductase-like flavin-dependent oxidoreductase (luciferase family)